MHRWLSSIRIPVFLSAMFFGVGVVFAASTNESTPVRLSGHVLPALQSATRTTSNASSPLTLTIVLARDDEAGFQKYLRDVYDPTSPSFRQFLSPAQIADRFGPSQNSYDRVAAYFASQNFNASLTSSNRLTQTFTATRDAVSRAVAVNIGDYTANGKTFFANDREPTLPADIAPHVQAVLGLSGLAQSASVGTMAQIIKGPSGHSATSGYIGPDGKVVLPYSCFIAEKLDEDDFAGEIIAVGFGEVGLSAISPVVTIENYQCAADVLDMVAEYAADAGGSTTEIFARVSGTSGAPPTPIVPGSGVTVGLVEFDSYQQTDVQNFLNFIGHPERYSHLSNMTLGAGSNFSTASEDEVLLDIDTVLELAPGANVVTYNYGFRGQGTFQTMFNAMITNGVNVISNSWAYCEDQTTLADVQSLEIVLQTAAAAGITVVTGSGDSGSTCLDGSANTVAVPASSASILAVGGSSITPGLGGTYGSEHWWDGSQQTPMTGQGGFGVSRFVALPSYQSGFVAGTMRSVPDVVAPADPEGGITICQADNGGCPTPYLYGGTSVAAPIWASFIAVLDQRAGEHAGLLNASMYPLHATTAFHSASMLSSDVAHVGLGSPNVSELHRLLGGYTVGAPSTTNSNIGVRPDIAAADGQTFAGVSVLLLDANYWIVAGQTVTLSTNVGSHAVITTINGTTDSNNGAAHFQVTDNVIETVTLTATTSSGKLVQTEQVQFVAPPAAAGSVVAAPLTQTADGASTSTITVTLVDAKNNPSPGKRVQLAQSGSSLVLGDNPATTDASGTVTFNVVDQVQESVTYTAVDLTDTSVPVPGSASVNFVNALVGACGFGAQPVAGLGYAISVYASGFAVQTNFPYGGTTLEGCAGIGGIAFDTSGNLFASDYITGDIFEFPMGGGVANASTRITSTPLGPSLAGMTFGNDGKLYATRVATTNVSGSLGALLRVDPTNGASTTVASNLNCPSNIATDPISGDLFVTDFCFNSGVQNSNIVRIGNPTTASPTVSTYADSSISPNGSISFASDGTMYVVYGYTYFGGFLDGIDAIGATSGTQPATVTPTGVASSFGAAAYGANIAGGAQALVVSSQNVGGFAHSVNLFDLTVAPAAFTGATLVQSDIGSIKLFGPDGCLYLANGNVVYKVTNADATCPLRGLAPNPAVVLSPETEPATVVQGTPLRFDVTFPHNPNLPVGTPVTYEVSGANAQIGSTVIGFGGTSFAYTGEYTGTDYVVATAQINGNPIVSNIVPVTWTSGKHSTFLEIDTSVSSGTLGSGARVVGSLFDTSAQPAVPIVGASVQFALTGQTCTGVTNAQGVASCSLALSAQNECTLIATFAGDSNFVSSSASELFSISPYDVIFANGFELPPQDASCSKYN